VGNTELTNNIIVENQASVQGSGLSIQHSPRLVHNTIANNHGGDGSGVYVQDGAPIFVNTILVSHTLGIYQTGATVYLEATLWGNDRDWAGYGGLVTGTISLWGDPGFVEPGVGDYRLGSGSAALDAGVDAGVTTDQDGQPRPYLLPDLGADEYWPPGTMVQVFLPLLVKQE
jgi:hypothetical protein